MTSPLDFFKDGMVLPQERVQSDPQRLADADERFQLRHLLARFNPANVSPRVLPLVSALMGQGKLGQTGLAAGSSQVRSKR
jgi:hypothetical protein